MNAKIFCLAAIIGCSVARAHLPLVCNETTKISANAKVDLVITTLTKAEVHKVKQTSVRDLAKLHFAIGLKIRNTLLRGKKPNVSLLKFYRDAGIKDVDSMSQDLIEGVWISGRKNGCNEFRQSDFHQAEYGTTEDLNPKKQDSTR